MRRRKWLLLLIATVLTSGCAGLPTSGPVVAGKPGLSGNDTIVLRASGPVRGSSPEQLIRDFKQACNAGPFEDFSTARLYLSEAKTKTWNPREKQIILAGKDGYTIKQTSLPQQKDASPVFSGTGQVVLTLDRFGRKLLDDGQYAAEFKLVKEKGEWRIAELPNSVAISLASFQYSYSRRDVFFVAASGNLMINDPRWLPRENLPRRIVEAVIAGPSVGLEPGLKVGLFAQKLQISQIEVKNNEVRVVIAQDSSLPDKTVLALLKKQLMDSLTSVSGINKVDFYHNNKLLTVTIPEMQTTNNQRRAIGIKDGALVVHEIGVNTEHFKEEVYLNKSQVFNYRLQWPVIGADPESPIVALGDNNKIFVISNKKQPALIYSKPNLRKPIVDRYNWIWSGSVDDVNTLEILQNGKPTFKIPVNGLSQDAHITEMRINSSGVRAIAAVFSAGQYSLYQMVIARNENGSPQAVYVENKVADFNDPILSLAWIDDSSYTALVKNLNNTLISYSINSFAQEKKGSAEAVYLVNNPPEKTIQIINQKLVREELRRQRWVELSRGIQYLSFSG